MAGHSGTPIRGEGALGVVPAFPSTPGDGCIFGTRLGSTFSKPWLLQIRRNDVIKGLDSHRCPLPEWRGVCEVTDVKCHALTMERGSETVVFLISQVTFQWLPGAFMTGGHS